MASEAHRESLRFLTDIEAEIARTRAAGRDASQLEREAEALHDALRLPCESVAYVEAEGEHIKIGGAS